jgi:general secretion pathway protein L
MLIIALPHAASTATTGYAHVLSDGQQVLRSATGVAATLSTHAGEVVAVVPSSRLSWFSLPMPPSSHGPRLMPVVQSLLEDRLLADADSQHIALPADAAQIARAGGTLIVGVCDKAWLRAALAPLQQAGLVVQRLVPEMAPSASPALYVRGTPEQSHSVLCHAQGVQTLPPNTAHWDAFADTSVASWRVFAESAMVERVTHILQRPPVLQTAAQRWLASTQSDWDLAQGEWAQGPRERLWRGLQAAWQSLRHAPALRPLRWGLVALLAVQVIGLNALAWREQRALAGQQAAMREILTRNFPQVTLVVDAPVQMQREVDALLRRTGAATSQDFEPLLAALASALPDGQAPSRLDFAENKLKVQGIQPNLAMAQDLLRPRGYRLSQEGDAWVLQAKGGAP